MLKEDDICNCINCDKKWHIFQPKYRVYKEECKKRMDEKWKWNLKKIKNQTEKDECENCGTKSDLINYCGDIVCDKCVYRRYESLERFVEREEEQERRFRGRSQWYRDYSNTSGVQYYII